MVESFPDLTASAINPGITRLWARFTLDTADLCARFNPFFGSGSLFLAGSTTSFQPDSTRSDLESYKIKFQKITRITKKRNTDEAGPFCVSNTSGGLDIGATKV